MKNKAGLRPRKRAGGAPTLRVLFVLRSSAERGGEGRVFKGELGVLSKFARVGALTVGRSFGRFRLFR